jgi:benzoylformate decarboxylase
VNRRTSPEPQAVAALAQALAACKHPVFVTGAEVDRTGAWDEIVALAERHGAKVFNAPMSARAGFPEDHAQFHGFLPAVRAQIVQKLAGHDLILVVGAPVFTYHVEGEGAHIPDGATLWQLTEDADAAARAPVGTSVVGDVLLALQALQSVQPQHERVTPPTWVREAHVKPCAPIQVSYLLQTIAELRAPDDVIVEEAPTARVVMHQHLPIHKPRSFFTMASGGLGHSMPAAAGIALAWRERRVIVIIGDGSSMYSIQTLWTAAQLGLNMTFIVVNNRRYGAMKRFGGVLGFPVGAVLPGTDLPGIDFVALAQGHGVPGERVEDASQLRTALVTAREKMGPSLVEVLVA